MYNGLKFPFPIATLNDWILHKKWEHFSFKNFLLLRDWNVTSYQMATYQPITINLVLQVARLPMHFWLRLFSFYSLHIFTASVPQSQSLSTFVNHGGYEYLHTDPTAVHRRRMERAGEEESSSDHQPRYRRNYRYMCLCRRNGFDFWS